MTYSNIFLAYLQWYDSLHMDLSLTHWYCIIQNGFVERLGPDFNPSNMLVVDLMHEFELGIWKGLFTHLIRLLHAAGRGVDDYIVALDRR